MKQRSKFKFDVDETFPQLASAPIVEGVIGWMAKATRPFDRAELQSQLSERLSDYPKVQADHELRFTVEGTARPDPSSPQVRHDTWRGFRLTSRDGLQIVQFNRDGVAFSRLAPYEQWRSFVAEALRVWGVFVDLAAPSEVQRLGVRFINRIELSEAERVATWLASPPKCLEPLDLPVKTFLYQSTHMVPGYPYQVRVVQTVQPPAPPQTNEFGLVLDIDVFTVEAFEPQGGKLRDHLEKMHWLKNRAFFQLISKRAISRLKRGKK